MAAHVARAIWLLVLLLPLCPALEWLSTTSKRCKREIKSNRCSGRAANACINCATPFLHPLGGCHGVDITRACSVPCDPIAVGFMKIDCRRAVNTMCGEAVHDPNQCIACVLSNPDLFQAATQVCVWPWITNHICHSASKKLTLPYTTPKDLTGKPISFDITGESYMHKSMFGKDDVIVGDEQLGKQLTNGGTSAARGVISGEKQCGLPLCKLDRNGKIPRSVTAQLMEKKHECALDDSDNAIRGFLDGTGDVTDFDTMARAMARASVP